MRSLLSFNAFSFSPASLGLFSSIIPLCYFYLHSDMPKASTRTFVFTLKLLWLKQAEGKKYSIFSRLQIKYSLLSAEYHAFLQIINLNLKGDQREHLCQAFIQTMESEQVSCYFMLTSEEGEDASPHACLDKIFRGHRGNREDLEDILTYSLFSYRCGLMSKGSARLCPYPLGSL